MINQRVIIRILLLFFLLPLLQFCDKQRREDQTPPSSTSLTPMKVQPMSVTIDRQLLYDRHTLLDTYPYRDTVRCFQWNKIRDRLILIDSLQLKKRLWAILQNYKNRNGVAPLVHSFSRNAYRNVIDSLGGERYQGIPLYEIGDTSQVPLLYGQDGSLVKMLESDTLRCLIEKIGDQSRWEVPKRYIKEIADSVMFRKVICIDRSNQNIVTLEKVGSQWLVRSMNPATTGLKKPPFQKETPIGLFVIQEKRSRMIFLKDGTKEEGGYAPWASRFSNGGFIHGVPINLPETEQVEFSGSLGTTPRSHMCVRNATSHARFVYEWAPVWETLVFVYD